MESVKGINAAKALLLSSSEEWYSLGQEGGTTHSTNLDVVAEGITSLLLIRVIAMNKAAEHEDLSTTSIATIVVNTGQGEWPEDVITPSTLDQARNFVTSILQKYKNVPFHNFEHAYHVVLCANKLLDHILLTETCKDESRRKAPPTFGLRTDPTALMALLFAALIHDVGHPVVTNRQRVQEQDEMAIRYNDESIHENYALSLAFDELLKSDYGELRKAMFPADAHYRYFRKLVIDSVLSTDLASPTRIQISRAKFHEAFADEDQVLLWNDEDNNNHGRRSSLSSAISKPRAKAAIGALSNKNTRRGSAQSVSSVISDISTDSYAVMQQNRNLDTGSNDRLLRRMSTQSQSMDSVVSDYDSVHPKHKGNGLLERGVARKSSLDSKDSMLDYVEQALKGEQIVRRGARRASAVDGSTPSMNGDELQSGANRRHSLNDSGDTDSSFGESLMAAESIHLAQNRKKGQGLSRQRNGNEVSKNLLPGARYFTSSDEDDNDELSLTPPSSDDEMEGVIITGVKDTLQTTTPKKSHNRRKNSLNNRRGSTSSTAVFNIEEEDPNNMNDSAPDLAFEIEAKHRFAASEYQGFGIRRSMDLSGESIDQYSVRDEITVCSTSGDLLDETGLNRDQPDEFRTSVVIELLLRTADISYWYQSDKLFLKFSSQLLQELMAAHNANRGMDPRPKWVQNQLNMAQQYVAVLAFQLQQTGIFGRNFDFWFPLPDSDISGEWRFPSHVIVKPLTALRPS